MSPLRKGDVLTIHTSRGLGVFQYVELVKPYGGLIRVFSGTHEAVPVDVQEVADQPERFWVFLPVGSFVRRGAVQVAGHARVPGWVRFPLMKNPAAMNPWEAKVWYLWDGTDEWPVSRDDPRLQWASPKETWNDTLLAERIASDWHPRDDLLPPQ